MKKQILFVLIYILCFFHAIHAKEEDRKERKLIHTYLDSGAYYLSVDQSKAIYCFYQVLENAQKINDERYIGAAYANLASMYYYSYNIDSTRYCYKKAFHYLLSAENYYLKRDNADRELVDIYNRLITLIDNLFLSTTDTDQYFKKALIHIDKIDPKRIGVRIGFYNRLATSLVMKGKQDSAIVYVDKCIALAKRNNRYNDWLENELLRGLIYANKEMYDTAIAVFNYIIPLAKKYNVLYYQYTAYYNLAGCLLDKGEYNEALKSIERAESMEYIKDDPNGYLNLLRNKADILEKLKKYKEQGVVLNKCLRLSDSLQKTMDVNKTSFIRNVLENESLTTTNLLNAQKIKQEHNLKYLLFVLLIIILMTTIIYQNIDSIDYIEKLTIVKNSFLIGVSTYSASWFLVKMAILTGVTINKQMLFLSWGLLNFVIPTLLVLVFRSYIHKQFNANEWSTKKHILFLSIIIVITIVANLSFGLATHLIAADINSIVLFFILMSIISILAIVIVVYIRRNRALTYHLQQSILINQQLTLIHEHFTKETTSVSLSKRIQSIQEPIVDTSENLQEPTEITPEPEFKISLVADNKATFVFLANSINYIEADDNYCEIFYTDKNQPKKTLLRSSLKKIEEQIPANKTLLIRCHRSYMVNLLKVDKVEGNANGYKLTITGIEEKIPVSRAYGNSILTKLKSLRVN